MSIYSGFATRFQEQSYDHCIDSLLYILQKRIIKFYQNERTDQQKFINLLTKLHHHMKNMEKSKYLQPKSSHSVNQLIKYIQQQPNILALSYTQPIEQENHKQQLPQIEPKLILPQTNQKKKNTLWVQKIAPVEKNIPQSVSNKTVTEQQVQTMGTINRPNQPRSNQQKIEFRRTTFQQSTNMRPLKVRNSSKSNLSRERSQKYDEKQKNRAMSNYLQQKPQIQSKVTYHGNSQSQANHHIQKRKHKSISRTNNQTDIQANKNQVSDIIKDYIIKAKKNYMKNGRTSKDNKDSMAKLQDF